jgi:DnaA family protein
VSTAATQLPLPLRPPQTGDFGSFVVGDNAAVVAALRDWAGGADAGNLLLHGEAGSGKSHLLHATCRAARDAGAAVAFVALDMPTLRPEMVDGLEGRDAVIVDAVQAIAGRRDWEVALFNLYNGVQASGGRLLFAARAPATALGLALPDLASRLSACATYALRPLDDAGRGRLLRNAAVARGMRLDEATLDYILKYSTRDTTALLRLLDELDQASLARRRAPNRRLVGELLRRPGNDGDCTPGDPPA